MYAAGCYLNADKFSRCPATCVSFKVLLFEVTLMFNVKVCSLRQEDVEEEVTLNYGVRERQESSNGAL